MSFNEFNKKRSVLRRFSGLTFFSALWLTTFVVNATLWAEEASEGVASAPEKLDPLAFKGDLALWTAVVFLFLLVILRQFAFDPIVKALDRREKNEKEKWDTIERTKAEAKSLLEEYRQKLADSETEVRQIIADAEKEAAKRAEAVVEEAKTAAANERERAVRDIQTASDVALQEIAVKSADLATTLAGKILKEQIDPARHSRLIEEAVSEITSK